MAVADIGDEPRALSLAQEAVDLYRKLKLANNSLSVPSWSFVESFYAGGLTILSSRFAAAGDRNGAHKVLCEAKSMYQGLITYCADDFCFLAHTLDLMAVNLRALNRHEEGIRIAQDLVDLQRRLETSDPEVSMLVRVALDELRTRPSEQRLRSSVPPCNHTPNGQEYILKLC